MSKIQSNEVLVLDTVHIWNDNRIFKKQCLALSNEGIRVIYFTKNPAINCYKNIELVCLNYNYKYKIERLIKGSSAALKKIIHYRNKTLIIHSPELLIIGQIFRIMGNRVVFDCHEDYKTLINQKPYISKLLKPIIINAYILYQRLFTKNIDIIIAEKYYKKYFQEYRLIQNFPYVSSNKKAHKKHNNTILYTGNIGVDRGSISQLKVLKLSNLNLEYCGFCRKEDYNSIISELNEDELERFKINEPNKYIDHSIITDKYKKNYLAGIAMFPFSPDMIKKEITKIFEYMSAGLPVICSNFPVWKSFIEANNCGYTADYNDDEEVQYILNHIIKNRSEVMEKGLNGRKSVEKLYNWELERKKFTSFIVS